MIPENELSRKNFVFILPTCVSIRVTAAFTFSQVIRVFE